MVLENAILFMRDALISREFTDAVKAGDSERVVLVLKTWALSFRAMAAMTENEFRYYDGMSIDENEEERPTEIGQILDDLVEGFEDSTLLRLSEEGVALDMDEVVVEVVED
jgi:hypothetical protein